MKAPDKIYLAESDNIRGEVTSNFASSTPFRIHSSIAYIRKDALLELAKEKKKQLFEQESANDEPSDVAAGINAGLDMVIGKLNSM